MKIKPKQLSTPENKNNSASISSVATPFHRSFGELWRQVDSDGSKRRLIRDFWPSVVVTEEIPDKPIEMLRLRLAYEFLALDHTLAKVSLPEKVAKNLEAARNYNIDGLSDSMKTFTKLTIQQQEGDKENMKTSKKAPKTNRVGVVHYYVEIFDAQATAKLTDEQIAQAIEKKSGTKPTAKNVSSYRCYYNQGKLDGQKGKPKEPIKAVRIHVASTKPKKPMSEETKNRLKAYTAAKKTGKTKIKIKKSK